MVNFNILSTNWDKKNRFSLIVSYNTGMFWMTRNTATYTYLAGRFIDLKTGHSIGYLNPLYNRMIEVALIAYVNRIDELEGDKM